MTALAGMPSVSRGMNAPPAAALLAASGPATPSIAPAPNRSGCRDARFSTAYEANDAMIAPAPGRIPRKKPSTEPRRIGTAESRQSWRVGRSPVVGGANISRCCSRCSRFRSTSEIPKSPMMTGTSPRPSSSVRIPKANRNRPLIVS